LIESLNKLIAIEGDFKIVNYKELKKTDIKSFELVVNVYKGESSLPSMENIKIPVTGIGKDFDIEKIKPEKVVVKQPTIKRKGKK